MKNQKAKKNRMPAARPDEQGVSKDMSRATAFAVPCQLPSYRTVTEVYDWGPSISKVIVNLGRAVKSADLSAQDFKVYVRCELAEGAASPVDAARYAEKSKGWRTVTRAYASDADGNPRESGECVALEFAVSPTDTLGAATYFDPRSLMSSWVASRYTITIGNVAIDNCQGNIRPQADKFSYGAKIIGRIPYAYASYEPEDGGKHPLIIWLHGIGDGGNSPAMPIMANKAVAFAGENIQRHFGGAYVLCPQARTYWMHGFNGFADGTSIYSETLMQFINNYVETHPGVDESRIYIGGDSSGGYMTMLLIRDNPGYFAAAFPTCEGLRDELISPKDLENIAATPAWFTAAKTDALIPPSDYTVPTVERLRKIGADVRLSLFDKVVDTSGKYKQADGSPHEYDGHWSWIYVYNDECADEINGQTVKLFSWLAEKTRR